MAALAVCAIAASPALAAGVNNAKFCLKGPGTTMNCKYDTMAACDKDKKTGEQCVANTTTTGSGSSTNSMKK
jgi:hypothetical protein